MINEFSGGVLTIEIDEDAVIHSATSGISGMKCTEVDSFLKEFGEVKTTLTEDAFKTPKPNQLKVNLG